MTWINQLFNTPHYPIRNYIKEYRKWKWEKNKKGVINIDGDILVKAYLRIKRDCFIKDIFKTYIDIIVDTKCIYRFYLKMAFNEVIIGEKWVYIPMHIAELCGIPLLIGDNREINWVISGKNVLEYKKLKNVDNKIILEYIQGIQDIPKNIDSVDSLNVKSVIHVNPKSVMEKQNYICIKPCLRTHKIVSLILDHKINDLGIETIILKKKDKNIYLWNLEIDKLTKIDFSRICLNGKNGYITDEFEIEFWFFNKIKILKNIDLWFEAIVDLKKVITWSIKEKWNFYRFFKYEGDILGEDDKCCILDDNSGDLVKSKCCNNFFLLDFMINYLDYNGNTWECPHCRKKKLPWLIYAKKLNK